MTSTRIGLSLRGGSARCTAYLGVIKVLEEYNLPITAIIGSSGGAVVGGGYAVGLSVEEILEEFNNYSFGKNLGIRSLLNLEIIDKKKMIKVFRKTFDHKDITETKIKFFVQVTNLNEFSSEIISKGDMSEYIFASSAMPLLTTPYISKDGVHYMDGDLTSDYGGEFLKKNNYADFVIGLNSMRKTDLTQKGNSIEKMFHMPFKVAKYNYLNSEHAKKDVDIIVDNLGTEISFSSFNNSKIAYEAGYKKAKEILVPQLKEKGLI